MKFKNMFSPIQIGPMTVKNRFVVPPMGNNFANSDGTWSDESVAYYGERNQNSGRSQYEELTNKRPNIIANNSNITFFFRISFSLYNR